MNTFIPALTFVKKFKSPNLRTENWSNPLPFVDKLQLLFLELLLVTNRRIGSILYVKTGEDLDPKLLAVAAYLKQKSICEEIVSYQDEGSGLYLAVAKKTSSHDLDTKTIHGSGVAEDKNTAFSKALGEIIERVVGGFLDQNQKIYYKKIGEIDSQYYNPKRFHNYTEKQEKTFPWLVLKRDTEIKWVKGYSLFGEVQVFIPRSLTSWYKKSSNDREYFINPSTNGSAGYFTKEGATVRGLLEVIQRDGFLVHWLTEIAPPSIAIDSLPESLKEQVAKIEQKGKLYILDTVTDVLIPSVVVVFIQSHSGKDSVSVSAAADVSYEVAIAAALHEIVPCSLYSRKFLLSDINNTHASKKEKENRPFLDKEARVKWWVGEKRAENVEWFLKGEKESFASCEKKESISSFLSDKQKLALLAPILKKYNPVVYYPEHPTLKYLGFVVAQVFIAELFPMYLVEHLGTFNSERLRKFFNFKKNKALEKVNTVPHPMS